MMIQLGLACFCIWAVNWIYLFRMVMKHTPNWYKEEVDAETIQKNFLENTSQEQMQFVKVVSEMNPAILLSAMVLTLFGMLT